MKNVFKIILSIIAVVLILLFGIWLGKMIFGTLALEVFKMFARAALKF